MNKHLIPQRDYGRELRETLTSLLAPVKICQAYVDSLTVWYAEPPPGDFRKKLDPLCGSARRRDKPMKYHPEFKCRIQVNQPSPRAITLLQSVRGKYLINRLDVAFDFQTNDRVEAEALGEFIAQHLRHPWPGKQVLVRVRGTTYTRQKGPTAIYCDDPSKPTLTLSDDAGKAVGRPCAHMEERASGAKQVRRKFGIKRWRDLRELDCAKLLEKLFRLETIRWDLAGRQFNGRPKGKKIVAQWFRPGVGYRDIDERTGEMLRSLSRPKFARPKRKKKPGSLRRPKVVRQKGKKKMGIYDFRELADDPGPSTQAAIAFLKKFKRIRINSLLVNLDAMACCSPRMIMVPKITFVPVASIPAVKALHKERKQRK